MNFLNIIQTTVEHYYLKGLASALIATSFLFGDIHTQAIIAVLILVVFDTTMGVMAAYSEGKAITSRRFSHVIQKLIVYMIAISSGYFADMTVGWKVIQSTMVGFIGVTEFISILENMGRLGYQTPKKLLNQLHDFQSQK